MVQQQIPPDGPGRTGRTDEVVRSDTGLIRWASRPTASGTRPCAAPRCCPVSRRVRRGRRGWLARRWGLGRTGSPLAGYPRGRWAV